MQLATSAADCARLPEIARAASRGRATREDVGRARVAIRNDRRPARDAIGAHSVVDVTPDPHPPILVAIRVPQRTHERGGHDDEDDEDDDLDDGRCHPLGVLRRDIGDARAVREERHGRREGDQRRRERQAVGRPDDGSRPRAANAAEREEQVERDRDEEGHHRRSQRQPMVPRSHSAAALTASSTTFARASSARRDFAAEGRSSLVQGETSPLPRESSAVQGETPPLRGESSALRGERSPPVLESSPL